jgi:hypothetical protein
VKFSREQVDDVIGDIQSLLVKHWQEIAHYTDIPLEPDFPRYKAMEKAGVLRIFTARSVGELVGYAIFVVAPALHYRSSIQATADVMFVDPDHRRGLGAGAALVRHCDAELAKEGVQVAFHRCKAKHDFGNLLGALGYELVDLVHARRLDRG